MNDSGEDPKMSNQSKTLKVLVLAASFLTSVAGAEPQRPSDHRPGRPGNERQDDLTGSWQFGRANFSGRTSITQNGFNEYTFTNERGDRSSGQRSGDWLNLREWPISGEIAYAGSIIEWSNGTYWHRNARLPAQPLRPRDLETSFRGGICNQVHGFCEININRDGSLDFVNEKGEHSRGRTLPQSRVVADDWQRLGGTVVPDDFSGIARIFWDNGTWWGQN